MLIDPSKTALILLGASRFDYYDDNQNRKSFASAHDRIKNYFLQSDLGPYLSDEMVCDLFDDEADASEQIDKIGEFLVKHQSSLEDVFVYIVTHGKSQKETGRFYLMVKTSRDTSDREIRDDKYILFETLVKAILASGRPRVYFIIDACYSGDIHVHQGDHVLSHESSTPPTGWNGKSACGGYAAILTSNSSKEPGPVEGKDEEQPPRFTRRLLEVLEKKGMKHGFSYGLSLNALSYAINECYREKLPNSTEPEFLEQTSQAQVSDRDLHGPGNEALVSSTPVFPNNDQSNVRKLVREASRDRIAKKMVEVEFLELKTKYEQLQEQNSVLTTENKQIKENNSVLTIENEQLQENNSVLTTENEQLQEEKSKVMGKNDLLKERNRGLEEEIRAADKCSAELVAQEKQNAILKHICVATVISLTVCVLVLSAEPEFWKQLASPLISTIKAILKPN